MACLDTPLKAQSNFHSNRTDNTLPLSEGNYDQVLSILIQSHAFVKDWPHFNEITATLTH